MAFAEELGVLFRPVVPVLLLRATVMVTIIVAQSGTQLVWALERVHSAS